MRLTTILLAILAAAAPTTGGAEPGLDLTGAVLVVPGDLTPREQKAATMLVEEVERRTGIRWTTSTEWPGNGTAVVALAPATSKAFVEAASKRVPWEPLELKAEGYRLVSSGRGSAPTVVVVGADERGVLFGAGRLLRELNMVPYYGNSRGKVGIRDGVSITTSPAYPLRGHQLGYRPKTNSYDAWSAPMWEQYIRELAIFGNNAVELIPPRSDDAVESPHSPEPQIDMMVKMSQICDDYGIDVWIWYPALDSDYSKPEQVEFALKEWGEVFARLPRIDNILVPGGDPGHTPVKPLMNLLAKETENLHRTHPKAGMWVSPQGFGREWTDEFVGILQEEQPEWLTGVVFAPQNFDSLADLRKAVPQRYPIRHYPDITHTVKCQFPVPDWDVAYALTEQREPINPRPVDYANIIRSFDDYTIGFITYSEGCNDDVNKIVWSCLGWDAEMPVFEALRQYARFFINNRFEYAFAQGLLALEENWRGPLLANEGVETTLQLFRDMEREATPQDKLNWRFQQALYRAYYDAYNRRRLVYETELEQKAMDALRNARPMASLAAVEEAERILDRAVTEPVAQDLRTRVSELAEALYNSVRMQLSVPRFQAIDVGRGANFDLIDIPVNDRLWLKARFAEIRAIEDERGRLQAIQSVVNWTDPGAGGFYDDLGNLKRQPHLVRDPQDTHAIWPWIGDPEFRRASLVGFQYDPTWRMSWITHAEARYDAPLILQYENLDPEAEYVVRVVYSGDAFEYRRGEHVEPLLVRLEADDGIEVHPFMPKPRPVGPKEFDIPRAATQDGKLTLKFYRDPGRGGNGRGNQVGEVWLVKKAPEGAGRR